MALAVTFGCGDDDGPATPVDAGGDTARVDTGPDIDTGVDAGPTGACEAADLTTVYETPADLPAFDDGERGRPIRCAQGETLSADTVNARATEREYAGPALTSGATTTVFSYRTTRASGVGALATATLYVPDEPATSPMPLLVYAHPTSGIGDRCAPSRLRVVDLERALYPIVGSGQAVVVPDYTGLGTEGSPAWLVPEDEAFSVLDAARGALTIAPEGTLSGEIFLAGHSQGGSAAMSAQAFASTYAPELDIVGVAPLAPVWIDTSAFGFMLFLSNYGLGEGEFDNIAFGSVYYIGHAAAYDGENVAFDMFAAATRDAIQAHFESTCIDDDDWTSGLQAIGGTVGQLFDPAFRRSVGDCASLGTCDDVGMTWSQRFGSDRPTLDNDGPPVWMLVGSTDRYITSDRISCVIEDIRASGATLEACAYEGIDHNHIANVGGEWIVGWMNALREGGSGEVPTCGDREISSCAPMGDGGVDAGPPAGDAGGPADAGPGGMDGGT
ncbi:MAG: hypothetical protein IT379_11460 [Deltaproteobacteria bacterium]|nr:hypothetical protein [Deltaproteobacteria bacterium]